MATPIGRGMLAAGEPGINDELGHNVPNSLARMR
jgi:hypothetical protein